MNKRRTVVIRRTYSGKEHRLIETDNYGEFEFFPAEEWMPICINYVVENDKKKILSFDSDGFGSPVYVGDSFDGLTVVEIFFNREDKMIIKLAKN